MFYRILAITSITLFGCSNQPEPVTANFAFIQVSVNQDLKEQTVLIDSDRITAISDFSSTIVPGPARTIFAQDQLLLPIACYEGELPNYVKRIQSCAELKVGDPAELVLLDRDDQLIGIYSNNQWLTQLLIKQVTDEKDIQ